ncbi:MAG TPA: hypothetical protein VI895_14520 [Bdellovibrionota bacterium]|nr:hypothetical protein [Bdellovibrionota bacterium]
MPLDGSPKKFAQDIAAGLISLNRIMLKRYTPPDIKQMITGLINIQKELRTEAVPAGDFQALKDKGMKMQRVNSAMMAIRGYTKENKLNIGG